MRAPELRSILPDRMSEQLDCAISENALAVQALSCVTYDQGASRLILLPDCDSDLGRFLLPNSGAYANSAADR